MNKKLDAKSVERISKALGEPYRLKIMEEIRKEKDWLACEVIISRFDLAQSTISHHIKQLVDADLLLAEKEGRNTKYKVNKDVVSAYTNFINGFGE
ncbi:ArsR/SmtB family transcription factor [Chitinophagaceae bacterium LWZ2-11]